MLSMKVVVPVMISILLISSLSCSKSHPSSPEDIANKLQGAWELRHMQMSWWPDFTFALGCGNTISFHNATWTMRQGSSEISGTFTITKFVQHPTPLGACNEIRAEEYPWLFTGRHNIDTVVSAGLR